MNGLLEAARRIATTQAEQVADELAATTAEELQGVVATREANGVVLSGRGLARKLAFVAPIALLLAALKARRQ